MLSYKGEYLEETGKQHDDGLIKMGTSHLLVTLPQIDLVVGYV